MADTKISELPAASSLDGSEVFPVVQGGVTKKVTTSLVGGTHPNLASHESLGLVTDTDLTNHASDTTAVHGIADTAQLVLTTDLRFTTVTANRQTGTAYTLVLADAGKVVETNNAAANTVTIPPNSSVAFPVGTLLAVWQYGAGQTTLVAGAGVTVRASNGLVIAEQYGAAALRKVATDEWEVQVAVTDPGGGGAHPDLATHDALGLATDTDLTTHIADTTAVHGIADTAQLVLTTDLRFTTVTANRQTGTAYTLVLADAGKVVETNNAAANTLTVPPNSSVAFPTGTVIAVWQYGAGQTTLVAGAGVTLRAPDGLVIGEQYGAAALRKIGTDEWEAQVAAAGGGLSAHASSHQPGGADPMAVDAAAGTGSLRTLGTGSVQAAAGNHTHGGGIDINAHLNDEHFRIVDTFTRADATLDASQTETQGRSWIAANWVVSSNKARNNVGSYQTALLETHFPFAVFEVELGSGCDTAEWWAIIRYRDASNYVRVGRGASNVWEIQHIVGGSVGTFDIMLTKNTPHPVPTVGDVLRVVNLPSDGIDVYVDGVLLFTGGETDGLSAPVVGLAAVNTTPTFERISHLPVGGGDMTLIEMGSYSRITANRQTANYTLVLTDASKAVEMNVASANTLTVPPNSSVAFPVGTVVEVVQWGAGQTTLTPGAGVTIRSSGGKLKTVAQYSQASLRKVATDEWIVAGDLVA